jgi:hypothetical protein
MIYCVILKTLSLTNCISHQSNTLWGLAVAYSWLRHYVRSRKIAGSIPDEVTGDKGWPARKADNLTAIYELIV